MNNKMVIEKMYADKKAYVEQTLKAMLMPMYDYCMPEKECTCNVGNSCEDPCEVFLAFLVGICHGFSTFQIWRMNP